MDHTQGVQNREEERYARDAEPFVLVALRTCKSLDIRKYSILLMSGTLNLLWNA